MHLRNTGARHAVNIINPGYYDKKTGLREMNRGVLNQSLNLKSVDAASVRACETTEADFQR
jgi:hypothetical protein